MKKIALLVWCTIVGFCVATAPARATEDIRFGDDVAPILVARCLECHGADQADGGWRVDTYNGMRAASDSGLAIVPGEPDRSELLTRLTSEDDDLRMPLDGAPLSPEQIDVVRTWIEQGARFDGVDHEQRLVDLVAAQEFPPSPEAYPARLPITALAFDAAGKSIYASGYHEVTVWDVASGELVDRIDQVDARIRSLDMHPNGERLLVASGMGGRRGQVTLIELTGSLSRRTVFSTSDEVLDARFDPSGQSVAVGTAKARLWIVDLNAKESPREITSHSDWIHAVAYSPDGSRIATASRDKTAKLFDAATGSLLISYRGHEEPVMGVAFGPQGEKVYSIDDTGFVSRWSIENGKQDAEFRAAKGPPTRIARSESSLSFAVEGGAAYVHEIPGKNSPEKLIDGLTHPTAIARCDTTDTVAVGCFDGSIHLIDIESRKVLRSWVAVPGWKQDQNAGQSRRSPR